MSTIKDVAKLAGVSVATVSRVINSDSVVTPATREIVEKAIADLDYNPNMLGRNLRKAQTKKILVLLPTIANQIFSKMVRGIEDLGKENRYSVVVGVTHSSEAEELRYYDLVRTKLFDGVVVLTSVLSAAQLEEQSRTIPLVQCSEFVEGADVPYVTIDNREASRDATNVLIRKGCRRIGIITNPDYTSGRLRLDGYRDALADAGIPFREEYVISGTFSFNSGTRAVNKLLDLPEPPDGIYSVSDSMAVGAIRGLFQRCGGQNGIPVIGFDDSNLSAIFIPSISTVSQPRYELGRAAMEMLLKRIRKEEADFSPVVLGHSVVLRESTENVILPGK